MLVKSGKMQLLRGFQRSVVKVVSQHFFCSMRSLKKAMLGLRHFGCYALGHMRWKTAIQMQDLQNFANL